MFNTNVQKLQKSSCVVIFYRIWSTQSLKWQLLIHSSLQIPASICHSAAASCLEAANHLGHTEVCKADSLLSKSIILGAYWITFLWVDSLGLFLLLKILTTSVLEILWAVSLKVLFDGGSTNKMLPCSISADQHFVHCQ